MARRSARRRSRALRLTIVGCAVAAAWGGFRLTEHTLGRTSGAGAPRTRAATEGESIATADGDREPTPPAAADASRAKSEGAGLTARAEDAAAIAPTSPIATPGSAPGALAAQTDASASEPPAPSARAAQPRERISDADRRALDTVLDLAAGRARSR